MYSSEYLPHFENDEQERIQKIKDHLKNNDLDYLYLEFDFDENEDIVDAYFDDKEQLHIVYNTTEPEDFDEYLESGETERFMCIDGKERNQKEYDEWLDNLMKVYQNEPDDLTEVEKQALISGCYIEDDSEDEDDDPYTDGAKEVLEKIQYELSDDERMYYWDAFEASQNQNSEPKTDIEKFWDWLESLDSDQLEEFGEFITDTEPVDIEEDTDQEKPWDYGKHFD